MTLRKIPQVKKFWCVCRHLLSRRNIVLSEILLSALPGGGLGRNLYVNNGKDAKKHALRREIWAATNSARSLTAYKIRDTSLDNGDQGAFRPDAARDPALQQMHAINRIYCSCFVSELQMYLHRSYRRTYIGATDVPS